MIYLDFETRSTVNIEKVGAWNYAKHPETEVLCMAYQRNNGAVKIWIPSKDPFEDPDLIANWNTCPISEFIERGELIEAHNAFFERCIWEYIMVPRYGWPQVVFTQWRCSAAKAAACSLPRSLEGAGLALDLADKKDATGKRIMLKMSRPRKPTKNNLDKWHESKEDYQALYDYCKKDVIAEKAVSDSLPPLSLLELKIWRLDQHINARGVYCDIEAVKGALEIVDESAIAACKKIRQATGEYIRTPGQISRIKEYCLGFGVDLPDVSKGTIETALAGKLSGSVRTVLEIRQSQSKSSVKKYQAMLSRADTDGRIRELLLYHGAGTGRWAGTGIQIQNFPKGKIKDQADIEFAIELIKARDIKGIEMFFSDAPATLSSCLRAMLCAAPGNVFTAADYKAIEARVLLWLANDGPGLQMFRDRLDIYIDMAATIYGFKSAKITKEQRELGKRAILGLGYQMGPKRFKAICWDWGKQTISIEQSTKIVSVYRHKYKSVTDLWRATEKAAIYCVRTGKATKCGKIQFSKDDRFLYCRLPSGRSIHYFDPKIEMDKKFKTFKLSYMGNNSQTHKWERLNTYGGKLVENATQAVARDLLAEAMIRTESAGYSIVLSVHDEIVCETIDSFGSVSELCALMEILPKWAKGLPVQAVGWRGKRFRK